MPTISIAVVNDKGDMAYGYSVLHASANDSITWTSETGPFNLTFEGTTSPFNEGLQFQSSAGSAPYTVTGTVKSNPAIGRYYYGVSAVLNANGKVYSDPGCPEIVIK